jgi:hypothetical protein
MKFSALASAQVQNLYQMCWLDNSLSPEEDFSYEENINTPQCSTEAYQSEQTHRRLIYIQNGCTYLLQELSSLFKVIHTLCWFKVYYKIMLYKTQYNWNVFSRQQQNGGTRFLSDLK